MKRTFWDQTRQDWQYYKNRIADTIGCLIYGIFMVALIGGGLWLLVAAVKWMWQHS
jgi:hypothetical protein